MTNPITDARTSLADSLNTGGFRTTTEVPQTFSPPLCWVAPRAPYRQPGQTFARKRVYLSVVCLAAAGTNAEALAAVDQLATDVADLVETLDGFRLDPNEEIGVPQLYSSAQNQQYLGAAVQVIAEVSR